MAERFTGQRCQDCQGGLIYVKAEKYWECPYCGKIYERELRFNKVQIDGLAGINDLVRSTLSKTLALDFEGAARDLTECEKIDHNSVGTSIAKISLSLYKSFFIRDRQQELTKVNSLLPKFNREFPKIDDPEELLYDFIESSDIYALLAVVYNAIGHKERLDYIYELLDCEEVFDPNVGKILIGILLKAGKCAEADILLGKVSAKNCRYAVMTVLNSYPSGMEKVAHVNNLLSKSAEDSDYAKVFDSYFEAPKDGSDVVVEIFLSAVSHNVNFNTSAVIKSVFAHCDTIESAARVFDAISKKRLDEKTANEVLNWCLNTCPDYRICEIGLQALFDSNSIFEMEEQAVFTMLTSEQEEDVKAEKIKQIFTIFKLSNKSVDKITAFHLLENKGSFEYRRNVFNTLASKVVSVQLSVVERYVLSSVIDGEQKGEMLGLVLAKSSNHSLFSGLFASYIKTAVDTAETRDKVIAKFLSFKISLDSAAFSYYLQNSSEFHSESVLKVFDQMGVRALSSTFDGYLTTLTDPKRYSLMIAYLATKYSFYLTPKNMAKYILYVSEPESKKVANTKKYLAACNGSMRDFEYTATVAGTKLLGNLAQIYFFTSTDDPYVIQEVVGMLEKEKIKLDDHIEDTSVRKKLKLRKFIDINKDKLSQKIITLAQELL